MVFQPIKIYFNVVAGAGNGKDIYYWKSKGLPYERINSIKTSSYGLTQYLSYYDINKISVGFNGGYLNKRPKHNSIKINSKHLHCL